MTTEPLDDFRARARAFIRSEVGPARSSTIAGLRVTGTDEDDLREVQRDRDLQRMFFDAGLAGITVPVEYGGQGLTRAHQEVLNEELLGYDCPVRNQVPTMTPCMAVLLDFGTEEQKRTHVPAILRGEELWMQFLSEPSGGSDVAGALTTAVRDGDEWILNGSKVWTTGAWWSDWGLCLARTNWDVPKHRGLSVFIFPIDAEGIEVQRIEMLNGNMDFCQEYLTDLRVPDSNRVGEVDDGWTVGTRWMFHERMASNSPYVTRPTEQELASVDGRNIRSVAIEGGRADDPAAQERVGEAEVLALVGSALGRRIGAGVLSGAMSDQASAIGRLFGGLSLVRRNTIAFELSMSAGAAWTDDDGALEARGDDFLMRQSSCIGGGTIEMAANVISERVLGMPREPAFDRDRPFREVPRGPSQA
ncbi:acyl-CoA dehydrogenase family protein [Dermatobacter hominis]|uniref:acyl-CoA dehydrogenase family protein n=1 Tax=Dermatobacter hominis TaxID=2884263 RepID=UPI001D0F9D4F|nr:acyl-CoA dehydrogenase family protein [Dermatobacter hominis]UDY36635.1 acyl-CoA dehydrogenase family protein [Dermatobacter hominis]